MFRKKKKEIMPWPLEGEYLRLCRLVSRTDLIWETNEYDKMLKRISFLAEERRKHYEGESEKEPEKKSVTPDTKVAAGVTLAAAAAPYIIEATGRTAQHLKGRVQLPNVWKK